MGRLRGASGLDSGVHSRAYAGIMSASERARQPSGLVHSGASAPNESQDQRRRYERNSKADLLSKLTGLLRRALRGPERAEHAAVAWVWLQQTTAAGALVEMHTGSRRHRLDPGEAAVRAGDRGGEHHHSAPGLPGVLLESDRIAAPKPVSRVR